MVKQDVFRRDGDVGFQLEHEVAVGLLHPQEAASARSIELVETVDAIGESGRLHRF